MQNINSKSQPEIDEGLYSRQLYVYGHEAMSKISSNNILISNCDGLSVEIAKNLALAGVKKIVITDDQKVSLPDLSLNCFLNPTSLKKSSERLSETIPHLRSLNPYCSISSENLNFSNLIKKKQKKLKDLILKHKISICVISNESYEIFSEADLFLQELGVKTIIANSCGFFAFLFNNFGINHTIMKKNDLELQSGIITSYSVEKSSNQDNEKCKTLTFFLNEGSKHELRANEMVQIRELDDEIMKYLQNPVKLVRTLSNSSTAKSDSDSSFPEQSILNDGKSFSIELYSETLPLSSMNYKGGSFSKIETETTMSFKAAEPFFENIEENSQKIILTDFAKESKKTFYQELLSLIKNSKSLGGSSKSLVKIKAHKKKYIEKLSKEFTSLDKADENVLRCLNVQLPCVNSVLGGVASQEVIKAASCNFSPIDQLLLFDFSELCKESIFLNKEKENKNFKAKGLREDNLIQAFGLPFVAKLKEQSALMIGSGAIGCELLKNFALMNFFTGSRDLVVIDDDKIERSNLNRQFLFREQHIGQPKAEVAASSAQQINPEMKIKTFFTKFDEKFKNKDHLLNSRNLLFAALDNQEARLFLDSQAVFFGRPLFESGTLGLKGNTQPIIPFLTENYGATRDPESTQIPACTLKHYPYKKEHTIHWARDLFDGEFRAGPEFASKKENVLRKENEEIIESENFERFYKFTMKHLEMKENVIDDEKALEAIVKSSIDLFLELFNYSIKQLQFNFPENSKNSQGLPFWSGTKRFPNPVEMSLEKKDIYDFIYSSSRLKCEVLNIPFKYKFSNYLKEKDLMGDGEEKYLMGDGEEKDLMENGEEKYLMGDGEEKDFSFIIKKVIKKYKISPFKPLNSVFIPSSDADSPSTSTKPNENVLKTEEKIEKEIVLHFIENKRFNLLEFEKDDDSNDHIRFIASAANLRARNYRIDGEMPWLEVKKTAGNIIPAVATTTAIVAGLSVIESLKYIKNCVIDDYKSSFLNLSMPMFTMMTPVEPFAKKLKSNSKRLKLLGKSEKVVKDNFIEVNDWDKIVYPSKVSENGLFVTLGEVLGLLEECEWTVNMIVFGNFCIYSDMLGESVIEERKEKTIVEILKEEKVIEEIPEKGSFLRLEVVAEEENGEESEIPMFALKI